jgi:hypothetical protein
MLGVANGRPWTTFPDLFSFAGVHRGAGRLSRGRKEGRRGHQETFLQRRGDLEHLGAVAKAEDPADPVDLAFLRGDIDFAPRLVSQKAVHSWPHVALISNRRSWASVSKDRTS